MHYLNTVSTLLPLNCWILRDLALKIDPWRLNVDDAVGSTHCELPLNLGAYLGRGLLQGGNPVGVDLFLQRGPR